MGPNVKSKYTNKSKTTQLIYCNIYISKGFVQIYRLKLLENEHVKCKYYTIFWGRASGPPPHRVEGGAGSVPNTLSSVSITFN